MSLWLIMRSYGGISSMVINMVKALYDDLNAQPRVDGKDTTEWLKIHTVTCKAYYSY